MKVHTLKSRKVYREYMCLIDLGGDRCQYCWIEKRRTGKTNLVESKLKPPKIKDRTCPTCKSNLVTFLDLPNEQKRALDEKFELDYLVQNLIYCPECRRAYGRH